MNLSHGVIPLNLSRHTLEATNLTEFNILPDKIFFYSTCINQTVQKREKHIFIRTKKCTGKKSINKKIEKKIPKKMLL